MSERQRIYGQRFSSTVLALVLAGVLVAIVWCLTHGSALATLEAITCA